jgi:hypothetical protein
MKELEDWAMRHPRVSAPFPGPKAREIHLTSALTTLIAVEEVVRHGFEHEETLEYTNWFAKVYRREGYPALFIDHAFPGERGKS